MDGEHTVCPGDVARSAVPRALRAIEGSVAALLTVVEGERVRLAARLRCERRQAGRAGQRPARPRRVAAQARLPLARTLELLQDRLHRHRRLLPPALPRLRVRAAHLPVHSPQDLRPSRPRHGLPVPLLRPHQHVLSRRARAGGARVFARLLRHRRQVRTPRVDHPGGPVRRAERRAVVHVRLVPALHRARRPHVRLRIHGLRPRPPPPVHEQRQLPALLRLEVQPVREVGLPQVPRARQRSRGFVSALVQHGLGVGEAQLTRGRGDVAVRGGPGPSVQRGELRAVPRVAARPLRAQLRCARLVRPPQTSQVPAPLLVGRPGAALRRLLPRAPLPQHALQHPPPVPLQPHLRHARAHRVPVAVLHRERDRPQLLPEPPRRRAPPLVQLARRPRHHRHPHLLRLRDQHPRRHRHLHLPHLREARAEHLHAAVDRRRPAQQHLRLAPHLPALHVLRPQLHGLRPRDEHPVAVRERLHPEPPPRHQLQLHVVQRHPLPRLEHPRLDVRRFPHQELQLHRPGVQRQSPRLPGHHQPHVRGVHHPRPRPPHDRHRPERHLRPQHRHRLVLQRPGVHLEVEHHGGAVLAVERKGSRARQGEEREGGRVLRTVTDARPLPRLRHQRPRHPWAVPQKQTTPNEGQDDRPPLVRIPEGPVEEVDALPPFPLHDRRVRPGVGHPQPRPVHGPSHPHPRLHLDVRDARQHSTVVLALLRRHRPRQRGPEELVAAPVQHHRPVREVQVRHPRGRPPRAVAVAPTAPRRIPAVVDEGHFDREPLAALDLVAVNRFRNGQLRRGPGAHHHLRPQRVPEPLPDPEEHHPHLPGPLVRDVEVHVPVGALRVPQPEPESAHERRQAAFPGHVLPGARLQRSPRRL
eukprot:Sspe_Gene.1002::Locus_341_Transcript_1_1_Confidence_1.000_Length_5042::g.1002::m.1002